MYVRPSPGALGLACLVAALASPVATAYEAGDWDARLSVHRLVPKDKNHEVVSVENSTGVTGSVAYFMTPTLAADLLVAVPFEHDVSLNDGGSDVASTRHLPPTLSLMWYPEVSDRFHPFLGAGINYTMFFDEKTRGALDGTKLKLDDSVGVAFAAGVDINLPEPWSLMVDARWFDIDTEAKLDGDSLGDIHIDPYALGVALAYKF